MEQLLEWTTFHRRPHTPVVVTSVDNGLSVDETESVPTSEFWSHSDVLRLFPLSQSSSSDHPPSLNPSQSVLVNGLVRTQGLWLLRTQVLAWLHRLQRTRHSFIKTRLSLILRIMSELGKEHHATGQTIQLIEHDLDSSEDCICPDPRRRRV
jgi:hypothetical protein